MKKSVNQCLPNSSLIKKPLTYFYAKGFLAIQLFSRISLFRLLLRKNASAVVLAVEVILLAQLD